MMRTLLVSAFSSNSTSFHAKKHEKTIRGTHLHGGSSTFPFLTNVTNVAERLFADNIMLRKNKGGRFPRAIAHSFVCYSPKQDERKLPSKLKIQLRMHQHVHNCILVNFSCYNEFRVITQTNTT